MIDPNLRAGMLAHQLVEEALATPEPYDDRTIDAVLEIIDEYAGTKTWASDIRQLKIVGARIEKLRGDRG